MSNLSLFMKSAAEISRRSSCKYHHHGAVIIRNGRVIAEGINNEHGHAEVNAVRNVYRLLRGSTKGKER